MGSSSLKLHDAIGFSFGCVPLLTWMKVDKRYLTKSRTQFSRIAVYGVVLSIHWAQKCELLHPSLSRPLAGSVAKGFLDPPH